jgi:SusD family.
LNAEVYSGTAQWTKAETTIDKVLEAGYTPSKNVRDPFLTNNDKSSEIIFSIPFDEDNFKGFRLHMRSLHYSLNQKFEMSVSPWNGLCSTFDQFERYEDKDVRKDAYFIYGLQKKPNGDIILDNNKELFLDPFLPKLQMDQNNTFEEIKFSGARVGKYEIKAGAKRNLSNDFPLFRISDFYLMKAEAAIRNGKDGKEWFNEIRKRAGVNELERVTLQDILDERARELWVEGHRRQDQNSFWKMGREMVGKSSDRWL